MSLPANKNRYNISLTIANVERFRALLDYFSLPPSALSSALDESIVHLCECLQAAKDEGKLGNDILWRLLGKQQKLNERNKKEEKPTTDKKCSKCGKLMHKFHHCELNPTAIPKKEKKIETEQKRYSVRQR